MVKHLPLSSDSIVSIQNVDTHIAIGDKNGSNFESTQINVNNCQHINDYTGPSNTVFKEKSMFTKCVFYTYVWNFINKSICENIQETM